MSLTDFKNTLVKTVFKLPIEGDLIEKLNSEKINEEYDDGVTPYEFIESVLTERDDLISRVEKLEQLLKTQLSICIELSNQNDDPLITLSERAILFDAAMVLDAYLNNNGQK